MTNLGDNL